MSENLKSSNFDEFIDLSEETRLAGSICPNKQSPIEDKNLQNSEHLLLEAAKEIKHEENKKEIKEKKKTAKDIQWFNEAHTVNQGKLNSFERFNDKYEGKILCGLPHGNGIYRFDGGLSYYKGAFDSGKYNGFGILHKHSGSHYVGSWSQNSRSDFGKQIYKNGDIYEGKWKENKCNGYGTLDYKDGSYYHGNWVGGVKSGYGVFKWVDGTAYNGEWIGNKKKKGVIYYPNGCTLKLEYIWYNYSESLSKSKFFDANGNCFKGVREDIYNKYLKDIDWHFKIGYSERNNFKRIEIEEEKTKSQIAKEKKKIEKEQKKKRTEIEEEKKRTEIEEEKKRTEIEEEKKRIEIEEEKKRIEIEEEKKRIEISKKKPIIMNEDESLTIKWYEIFECCRRKNKKLD